MSHFHTAINAPHYPGCPVARGQREPCVGPAGMKPSRCECGYAARIQAAVLDDAADEALREPLENAEWLRGVLAESERRGQG